MTLKIKIDKGLALKVILFSPYAATLQVPREDEEKADLRNAVLKC